MTRGILVLVVWCFLSAAGKAQWCAQETQLLLNTDPEQFDHRFGASVSLSGTRVAIGAPHHDGVSTESGAAYVFEQQGTAWLEQQRLEAIFDGGAYDKFGWAVAMQDDTLFAGAPLDDDGANSSGSVYEFEWDGTAWNQVAKYLPTDPNPGKNYGVALKLDGDRLFVGAPGDDDVPGSGGAVYIYQRSGSTWTFQQKLIPTSPFDGGRQMGYAFAVDGNTLVVGGPYWINITPGEAYVYEFDGTSWSKTQDLVPSISQPSDRFGMGVAVTGDWILGSSLLNEGTVFAFQKIGTTWVEQQVIAPNGLGQFARFGAEMVTQPNLAVIAAPGDDVGTEGTEGSVFFYHLSDGVWSKGRQLIESVPEQGDTFGGAIDIEGLNLMIGAWWDIPNSTLNGSVFSFRLAEFEKYGTAHPGSAGVSPKIRMVGCPVFDYAYSIDIAEGLGGAPGFLLASGFEAALPLFGGTLLVLPPFLSVPHSLSGSPGVPGVGGISFPVPNDDPTLVGITFYLQGLYLDAGASDGFAFTRGMRVTTR
jgi:hypothetical protein